MPASVVSAARAKISDGLRSALIIVHNVVDNLFSLPATDRLGGLVVKASASRVEDPGSESRLRRDFFGVESYQ